MNKEKKLPGLRFPGFDGEWEEKKIIDVAPLQGDYPVVMSNGINGYHYKFKAKAPGVVTGRSGTLGNLNYIESNYWPHNTTLWVTDFKGNNPRYIYYMYQKLDLVRFGTGSGVPTLNRNDVHDTRIFIPNHEEQCNISLFLCSLDKLIALHQQKLTHLQERKKGLLQKMFPKAGEKVPELRFPGFSGDWEEKKLGEVAIVNSGRDYKHLNNGTVPVYGTGGYMLSVDDALSYDTDGIGIGRKGTIDMPFILRAPFWTVDTLFYVIPKNNFDLDYLYAVFQNINWKKLDESTGVPSLSKTTIVNVSQAFPIFKEQQKIGTFFKKIDNSILLQQQKLEHLKDRKKALLQQMFV
jgi:type I restriction enzyme S subunit